MPTLRQRKPISYAALIPLDGDEEEGAPENGPPSDDSDSVFSGRADQDVSSEEILDDDAMLSDGESLHLRAESDHGSDLIVVPPTTKRSGAGAVSAVKPTPILDTIYASNTYVARKPFLDSSKLLEASSISHTKANLPHCLYDPPGALEVQLPRKPALFGETDEDIAIARQNHKVMGTLWSRNLSWGPLHDLVADRGWYKEQALSQESSISTGRSKKRGTISNNHRNRPRVYEGVKLEAEGFVVISQEEATKFLPQGAVSCEFKSRSGDKEVEVTMSLFGSHCVTKPSGPEPQAVNHSYVFNAGAPVLGLDWCPISDDDASQRGSCQYIAVGTLSSKDARVPLGGCSGTLRPGCIQIWSFGANDATPGDEAKTSCDMIVCTESGCALELRWCPLPSHDGWGTKRDASFRKLGILGGVFEDGSVSFYAIPDPQDVRALQSNPIDEPVYVKLTPLLRIALENTPFQCFDWANSELIAAGTTDGSILTYHLKAHFLGDNSELLPSTYILSHQSGIRSVAWIRTPSQDVQGHVLVREDPTLICSVGYDGEIHLVDTRDATSVPVCRYRDVLNTVVFSTWCGAPLFAESNQVKRISLNSFNLGKQHGVGVVDGVVSSLAASDLHPMVAVATASGGLEVFNSWRTSRKNYNVIKITHKVYQMDFNRNTKSWRMLDQFIPKEFSTSRNPTARANQDTLKSAEKLVSIYPTEMAIHRAAWNQNGLAKAQLLISGTASGLCRIDSLWGWLPRHLRGSTEMKDEDDDE